MWTYSTVSDNLCNDVNTLHSNLHCIFWYVCNDCIADGPWLSEADELSPVMSWPLLCHLSASAVSVFCYLWVWCAWIVLVLSASLPVPLLASISLLTLCLKILVTQILEQYFGFWFCWNLWHPTISFSGDLNWLEKRVSIKSFSQCYRKCSQFCSDSYTDCLPSHVCTVWHSSQMKSSSLHRCCAHNRLMIDAAPCSHSTLCGTEPHTLGDAAAPHGLVLVSCACWLDTMPNHAFVSSEQSVAIRVSTQLLTLLMN